MLIPHMYMRDFHLGLYGHLKLQHLTISLTRERKAEH